MSAADSFICHFKMLNDFSVFGVQTANYKFKLLFKSQTKKSQPNPKLENKDMRSIQVKN